MKKEKKRILRRAAGIFLSICMVLAVLPGLPGGTAAVSASTESDLAELQKQREQLDKEIKEAQNKIDANKSKISDEKDKQADLETQILDLESQITLYQKKIETVTIQIDQKSKEIELKEMEIAEGEQKFADRLHAMYISQVSDSTMKTLVSAKSFTELINRMEYLKRISETDQEIVDNLTSQKTDLSNMKAQLEADKADLESTKGDLDARSKETQGLYSRSEAQESELLQANKEYMEKKQKLAQQQKEADAEIDRLIRELSGTDVFGDGTFTWPLPGYGPRDGFGWRTLFGQPDYHPALDCPAPAGTNILAAGNGKVLFVRSGPSYGNNLAIDHGIVNGKSIVTLYAHCSRIDVAEGQMVTKGQVIAGVGTTGNSTGNHLHLEFRVDNEKVNPLGYVTPY